MVVIGLTGGIGSGKSTVSAYLKKMQIPVFDADAASRGAVRKGSTCLAQVAELLGPDCLLPTGELDRQAVARRVFADKALLKQYETIVQAQIWREARVFLERHREQGATLVVLDVPLLIESGWYKFVDRVWLVKVPREIQIERAMLRDHAMRAEVLARIEAQMPLEEKLAYADAVIDNTGSPEETRVQVQALVQQFSRTKQEIQA